MDDEDRGLSFEQIHRKYNDKIYNLILRIIGDPEDAGDLTQETFLNAYRAWDRFRGDTKVSTWLYTIAHNCCKNRFKQKDRQKDMPTISGRKPLRELSSDEALAILRTAVQGLLFPSESDRPIVAITLPTAPGASPSDGRAALEHAGKIPAGAQVEPISTENLLGTLTQDQSWFGDEEKATAQRFRELLALLQGLGSPAAFRIAPAELGGPIAIFVVGAVADAGIIGISTQAVET